MPIPAFYAYAYPEPAGFATAPVKPAEAFYSPTFTDSSSPTTSSGNPQSPDATLLDFLQTTYEAAANLGKWDRAALERDHAPGAGA